MFKDIFYGDIDNLLATLDTMKTLKLLRVHGYELPGEFKTEHFDEWDDESEFALKIIQIIANQTETLDPDFVLVEEAEEHGYADALCLLNDEQEAMEIIIPDPDVREYLDYWREQDVFMEDADPEFVHAVSMIIDEPYFADYVHYSSCLGKHGTELVILATDWGWFNCKVLEKILDVIEYCRNQNRIRRENHGM